VIEKNNNNKEKGKMIPGIHRSITFPISHRTKGHAANYVRSMSFPAKSHPLIANLKKQIRVVESWASGADASLPAIKAGLSHIEQLLLAINEFLSLSETKTMLRHTAALTECLLESFLYLVDSYGLLLSEIVTLKQHLFEVQSALRRHDSRMLASSVKSQRRIEKGLSHLAGNLRAATKCLHCRHPSDDSEAEIVGILVEAISNTSAASGVLLGKVVSVLATASTSAAMLALCAVRPFKKRNSDGEKEMSIHEKIEELEECIEMVERGSERVLGSLINARVLLLNIESGLL
jgi:Arabidopsis protein of unknown function